MPPRLRSAKFPSSTQSSLSCNPSTRTQGISQPPRQLREFSQTSCQHLTLRRRRFYEWMNGPGQQLKDPLPGTTNYLGAYDRYGNLVRAPPGWTRDMLDKKDKDKSPPAKKADDAAKDANAEKAPEDLDALEAAIREGSAEKKESKTSQNQEEDEELTLGPETEEDLRPFPVNPHFRSQSVLSEDLREAIYQRVKRDGVSVSLASVEFGVSNERVGAVVRLKQMEKEWIAQGKRLAIPYSKAVLNMLPTTPFIDTSKPENRGMRPVIHEPINDLIVHPATRQQLFVPVSESRRFTRVDAGKAFDNNLLPADDRIPHPELIHAERELASGLGFEERRKLAEARLAEEKEAKKLAEEKKQAELKTQKVVPQRRWDFVFQNISVDAAGRDGRSHKGIGWRYGVPHNDRKKGIVKIPTKVEA